MSQPRSGFEKKKKSERVLVMDMEGRYLPLMEDLWCCCSKLEMKTEEEEKEIQETFSLIFFLF
jgi:hypothetical protein